MPEQALYLKWRPTTFDDVVGQEHVVRTLRNSLVSGRIRHAYLFSGPRGTGKTTTARLLAKAINCQNENPDVRPCNECPSCVAINEGRYLDLIEIDAATHTGVDDVRDLRDKIAFAPGEGQYKVYIIDEVHRFTGNAFDALLKTLEEPPAHAIFVLATTEIDKVPSTIKSRCLQFEFRRVSLIEVADRLQMIAESEGLRIEREAVELIAREGTGSVRDSISLLDQIVADPGEVITLELTQRILGTANNRAVQDIVQSVIDRRVADGLRHINAAVDSGSDPRQLGQQIVEHMRALLMTQTGGSDLLKTSEEQQRMFAQQAVAIDRSRLLRATRAFNEAISNYKGGWQPQLSLELALMDSIREDESEGAAQQAAVIDPRQIQRLIAMEIERRVKAGAIPAADDEVDEDYVAPPEVMEQESDGVPAAIPVSHIREKWVDIQRHAKRYSASLPALLEYAEVMRVEGNWVVIGVPNNVFREKLNVPEKRKALDTALREVLQTTLGTRIMLMDDVDAPTQDGKPTLDDPLAMLGQDLGGRVHYEDEEDEYQD